MTQRSTSTVEHVDSLDSDTWPLTAAFGAWGHDEHWHPYGHLVLALAGDAVLSADGVTHVIATDQGVWVPSRVPHRATFQPGFAPLVIETGDLALGSSCLPLHVSRDLRRRLIARRLDGDDPVGVLITELERLRQLPDGGSLTVPDPTGPLTGAIAAAFAGDASDPRTLTDWAETLHCSGMSIRRAFREETGISFSEWRTRRRLAVSLQLLRSGSPVSSAAYAVGLTHNGLIAAYRRHLGAPPSSFVTSTPE